jgi:ribosomal protein L22
MSPEKPADPGKPGEEEQVEAQAAEAKPAAAKPARSKAKAKAKADSGAEKAKPARARAKKAAPAEDTADAPAQAPEAEAEAKPARRRSRKPAAEKAAPAPRRSRTAAKAAPSRRNVSARARYVRTSARKARMVCGHLRGKSVQEARAILAFTPREVARDWSKLLESAVANAESNHELLEEDLFVREAYADEGPTIKRFRPRAMGRATPIRKRTSHLTITLTTRAETDR